MIQNEKQTQNNAARDAFEEYLNDLPDDSVKVSSKVEEDLIDYSNNKGSYAREERRSYRRMPSERPLKAILVLTGVVIAMASITTVVMFNVARSDDSSIPIQVDTVPVEEYEYEDPYALLGTDLSKPEFVLDGHYYQLPVSYSDFMQEGWSVENSLVKDPLTEVGSEVQSVRIVNEYDEFVCEALVRSATGETVPLEEAQIIGIVTDQEYKITLPMLDYYDIYSLQDAMKNVQNGTWNINPDGYHVYAEVADEQFSDYTVTIKMADDYELELVDLRLNPVESAETVE